MPGYCRIPSPVSADAKPKRRLSVPYPIAPEPGPGSGTGRKARQDSEETPDHTASGTSKDTRRMRPLSDPVPDLYRATRRGRLAARSHGPDPRTWRNSIGPTRRSCASLSPTVPDAWPAKPCARRWCASASWKGWEKRVLRSRRPVERRGRRHRTPPPEPGAGESACPERAYLRSTEDRASGSQVVTRLQAEPSQFHTP